MSSAAHATHRRHHQSLLAASEKRGLIWLAERMPGWVSSDQLTALGLLGMALAGAAFMLADARPQLLLLVVLALGVNWFGDSLDGTLARVRNRQRPRYGFYIDHILDLIGATLLLAGMGFSRYMSIEVAAVLLVVYLLLNAEIYLATHTLGTFRLSYWKLGPTELRIMLAAGVMRLLQDPTVTIAGRELLLFDVGGAAAALALTLTLLVSILRNATRLAQEERLD